MKTVKMNICHGHNCEMDCLDTGHFPGNCPEKNGGKVIKGYFISTSDYRKLLAVVRAAENIMNYTICQHVGFKERASTSLRNAIKQWRKVK